MHLKRSRLYSFWDIVTVREPGFQDTAQSKASVTYLAGIQ
jgi:hypothetical protein